MIESPTFSGPGLPINTTRQSCHVFLTVGVWLKVFAPLKICESKGNKCGRARMLLVETCPSQRCETPKFYLTRDLLSSTPINMAFSDFKGKKVHIKAGASHNTKFKDYIPTCTHTKWTFSIFQMLSKSIIPPEKLSNTTECGIILWTWQNCKDMGR